jgi:hypothetical protein
VARSLLVLGQQAKRRRVVPDVESDRQRVAAAVTAESVGTEALEGVHGDCSSGEGSLSLMVPAEAGEFNGPLSVRPINRALTATARPHGEVRFCHVLVPFPRALERTVRADRRYGLS